VLSNVLGGCGLMVELVPEPELARAKASATRMSENKTLVQENGKSNAQNTQTYVRVPLTRSMASSNCGGTDVWLKDGTEVLYP
jgi:hypothetical protein